MASAVPAGGALPSSPTISGRTPNLYGTYLLTVRATDGAGNSDSAQAAFAWQNSVYTFTYDALDRLTSAYGSSYSYDSLGRPNGGSTPGWNSLTYTQAPGHAHAVASVTRQTGTFVTTDSYAYDPDGNLTAASLQSTGQAQTLAWDAENRLISVTVAGGTTEQYLYDQDGQWAVYHQRIGVQEARKSSSKVSPS
jgi:YD repeat-containing protein